MSANMKGCIFCRYANTGWGESPCWECVSSGEHLGWEARETEQSKEQKTTFHDKHYQSEHQPIETMQANMTEEEFQGFLKGNILKYVCRCGKKDEALKEAQKIQRYATWLVESLEGKTINPRM